jgi:hypothetical protein
VQTCADWCRQVQSQVLVTREQPLVHTFCQRFEPATIIRTPPFPLKHIHSVHFGGIVNQCAIHSQIATQFTATINIEAHTFCAPIGLGYYTNLVVAISLLERIALEQSNQILHKGTGIAGMLPIPVSVGSWRFPTDNFSELNAPFFDNEGIVWGPPTEDLSPLAYQVSLDIYNQWCEHAYDWVAICNHLQDVDFQQAEI